MKKVSEETKNDFTPLLQSCSEVGLSLLKKQRQVYPICFYLDKDNKVNNLVLDIEIGNPETNELVEEYKKAIKKLKVKAVCIGYMVTIKEDTFDDAFCIDFNHSNGDTMRCLIPYSFTGIMKRMNIGDYDFSEESIKII